ncbi:MAG: M3 family peptidase [Bacteroidetes bacterium]|nr:MAG: M3 family peptidase [Bacteroidota bacterium]
MRRLLLIFISMSMILSACKTTEENPFFVEWDTPFGSPPFHLIDEEHYIPAYEEGIRQHQAEIDAIVNNPEAPTFENTIVAYDQAGSLLRRISLVFGNLRGAETNPQLQEIARETTPLLSAHSNEISMNQDLFARIQTVYENRFEKNLNPEQLRVVEMYYRDFERNGAALPEEKREELARLRERMSMISLELGENMLAETNAFELILEDEDDLAGLPAGVVSAAAEAAERAGHEGKWLITLHNPSRLPFLQFSERRDLREKVLTAYGERGNNDNENDNKELFAELMQLRLQMARLLGFNNYAEYFLDIQMAENPDNVYDFLNQVWDPAVARAKRERDMKQAIIDREGGDFKLEAWDWWYYAEILRQERYDLDDDEVNPYFTIENVKRGNFMLANKLWGLTFEPRPEVPVYHEEVEVYEVFDNDGSHLAILFIDPHPRPGKRQGAWCGTYRSGGWEDGEWVSPIVTIVMNFSRPSGGKPAMLSWDETTTYFHEFGHAVHNFFAKGNFRRTSRSVPRDFVELPSQILENWAGEPELLKTYAIHYETGEPIPDELISRLRRAEHFNQGFINVEYLASAFLDMDWHTTDHGDDIDVIGFEEESMRRIGLPDEIIPRWRTTYFGHIFGPGYAAGYYVYRWAGVLDADAFMAFKESGDLFNQELAERFRYYILANNALYEGMEAYVSFRGQEPDIDHFLRQSGLK